VSETRSDSRNIVLVGFMGSGKSSVGAELARRLGRELIDTDEIIERSSGATIPELFAQRGETAFRDLESEAVREAAARRGVVISTGGGAILRLENLRALRESGTVVYLRATPESIHDRVRGETHRPLLQVADPTARIRELLQAREPYYAQADAIVDTDGKSIEALAAEVASATDSRATAQPPTEIVVRLGSRSYPIVIGRGVLAELASRLSFARRGSRVAVVTSERLADRYGARIVRHLEDAGFAAWLASIPDGEEHKNLSTASRLYDLCAERRMERQSPIVAVGGGTVGDIAGFVAATYMRGVPFVQVPTSLIAQVDASVGGKVAVDHPKGKNLIGAFYQPRLVLADIAALATLPDREFRAGIAEVLRYAVIASPSLFETLERRMPEVLARDERLLTEIVAASCAIKARIVEEDEDESGVRATLNYGHTFGHAIEAVTGYRDFLHGEAVALGELCAAELSRARGLVDGSFCDRQRAILTSAGLPTALPAHIDPRDVAGAMWHDKKVDGGRIRFILPTRIGNVVIRDDFAEDEIVRSIEAALR